MVSSFSTTVENQIAVNEISSSKLVIKIDVRPDVIIVIVIFSKYNKRGTLDRCRICCE